MSSYLEVARQARARRNETRIRLESEAVTDVRATRQGRSIHLDPEGCKLEAAGFEPKERGGKIIWQRPDTSSWYSQETALRLLENRSKEEEGKKG